MSREIYLLGVNEAWATEEQVEAIAIWTKKLGQLGVGSLSDVVPTIMRPEREPYQDIAEKIAENIDGSSIHELDLLKTWELPFNSAAQVAACLSGSSALVLRQNNIERKRHEQRVILGSQSISEEFLRHCPSSMHAEVMNSSTEEVMWTYVHRDVSPRDIKHR